jgi:hypothetical protein
MATVRREQPPPPDPVYIITLEAGEVGTFLKMLDATTYGLAVTLKRLLREKIVLDGKCKIS